jgi:GTP cyclohydrolase II/3,4-dihydroxy 2-butanone 4-phosphate synthase/GTP cyclohydrolase II
LPSALVRYAEAEVPTEYGPVRTVVYRSGDGVAADGATQPEEHIALVVGDPARGDEPVLVRVHSECWTGEVLRSHKCDCRDQLDQAMRAIASAGRGVVVYLRQEGRGIGLGNKVRAYALQQAGVDTVEANRMLGFADDARRYDVAAAILRDLGVGRVALMTNNPKKVQGLVDGGIDVVQRVPIKAEPNLHSAEYLAVKARKMGHEL